MHNNVTINDHLEEVNQLIRNGRWNEELLLNTFNEEVCAHVCEMGYVQEESDKWDKPW